MRPRGCRVCSRTGDASIEGCALRNLLRPTARLDAMIGALPGERSAYSAGSSAVYTQLRLIFG